MANEDAGKGTGSAGAGAGDGGAGGGGAGDAGSAAAAAEAARAAAGAAAAAAAGKGSGGEGDAGAGAGAADDKGGKKDPGWNETWRQDYAGKDEKLLKRLERYASPKAALDALIAAQNKISSGEVKHSLPDKPTAEELTEYRKEHGIPDKPEGYLENLPNGLVIGDEDKPLFESFVKGLHDLNSDPKIAAYAVKWYNDFRETEITKQAERDEVNKSATEDALRAEWGNDYRTNVNSIHGLLDAAQPEVAEAVLNARMADGTALLNNPQVMRWLTSVAREINPVHSIVPGSGSGTGAMGSISEEIGRLEKYMKDERPKYNKDTKAQERLRELYDARGKLSARSAA